MRNLSYLNIIEFYYAGLLTFLQEMLFKMYLISDEGRVKNIVGRMFDKVSQRHFKLFYGESLESVIDQIKDLSTSDSLRKYLSLNVVGRFAQRQVEIECKYLKMYQGVRIGKNVRAYLKAIMIVHYITGKSKEECLSEMNKIIKEKVDAARKTP